MDASFQNEQGQYFLHPIWHHKKKKMNHTSSGLEKYNLLLMD
jgi:hypothetical protein